MYNIFAGETCIYDGQSPLKEVKVTNPKLSMADNSAGSLTFTMQSQNAGYDVIERLATEITIKKDGEEIWAGRIINEEKDFLNQRKVTCEGELAYLNDTTQPMHEYHIDSNTAVAEFLQALLNNHNSKATSDMQFQLGVVTVTDPNGYLYRYTNYESTLECIKEKLLDKLGGHLRVRKENGIRKLDYLADYYDVSGQTIEFGKNLIDFTSSWDLTELATVVLPLGNQLEESSIEALQEYLTIKEADTLDEDGITHEKDSIYVKSDDAISTYGWIETVVRWDDVSVANNLMAKAKNYLMDAQFEKMVIELSAVDLHNLNPSIEALKLLHKVECISPPHGMDRMFPVTKMDIPLDKPEETIYTLGTRERMSMSAKVREGTKELMDKIEDSSYSALSRAKKNAASILNSRTRGYITIDEDETNEYSQELIISDNKDPKKATRLWVWNMGGLGHFPNGRYNADGSDKEPNVAITMDGAIVADFITTGTMSADRVRAGLIQDEKKYNYWNLSTGELVMNSGHAKVGTSPVASEAKAETIASNKATAALDAYDTSLNQSAVFNKLTKNGALKGIYMQDGRLYINADYLKSGAIDASIIDVINLKAGNIVTGKISDKVGYNFWNLDTGEFRLSSGTKVGKVKEGYAITSDVNIVDGKKYYYKDSSGSYKEVDHEWAHEIPGSDIMYIVWPSTIAELREHHNSEIYEFSPTVVEEDLSKYIDDNSSMTKQEIFNTITDNGANQGVFMLQNGNLYINASYINSGEINADLITTGGMSADRITSGEMSAERLSSSSNARLHDLTLGNDLLVVGKLKIKRKWDEISDSTKEYSGITGKYKLGDNNYYFLDGLLVKRD